MLAAVWQLMRLGLLRDQGRPVVTPQDWTDQRFPDSWDDLPPVIRLKPGAAAFAAYTTLSVLSPRFLPVELAVRTILSQFACDSDILAEADRPGRARRDATARRTGRPDPVRVRGPGRYRSRVKPRPVTRRSDAQGRRRSHNCSNRCSRSRTRSGSGASRVRRLPGPAGPR